MTIESLLDSGCSLSHKSAQDGCNGTRVKLEAPKFQTHVKWKYGTFNRLKVTIMEENLAVNQLIGCLRPA